MRPIWLAGIRVWTSCNECNTPVSFQFFERARADSAHAKFQEKQKKEPCPGLVVVLPKKSGQLTVNKVRCVLTRDSLTRRDAINSHQQRMHHFQGVCESNSLSLKVYLYQPLSQYVSTAPSFPPPNRDNISSPGRRLYRSVG